MFQNIDVRLICCFIQNVFLSFISLSILLINKNQQEHISPPCVCFSRIPKIVSRLRLTKMPVISRRVKTKYSAWNLRDHIKRPCDVETNESTWRHRSNWAYRQRAWKRLQHPWLVEHVLNWMKLVKTKNC